MVKLFFIVIDGGADKRSPEFGNVTAYEKASTPNIDKLARFGKCGLCKTFDRDYDLKTIACNATPLGTASLLGFAPSEYYIKRGPVEAFGIGRELKERELAFRVNFANLSKQGLVSRRLKRKTEGVAELVKYINRNLILSSVPETDFELIHTAGHRGILILRSEHVLLSDEITPTDPFWEGERLSKCEPTSPKKEAGETAKLVNEFTSKASKFLNDHPINLQREKEGLEKANLILTRGAGRTHPRFENLSYKFKKNFACIAPMPGERGVCRAAGMDIVWKGEVRDDPEEDALVALCVLEENLNDYDCFLIFLKGPDPFGHDGDFLGKTKIIEWLDFNFFEKLLKVTDFSDSIYVVASDHATPCCERTHTLDPVPFVVSGGVVEADIVTKFSEASCAGGFYATISATKILKEAMDEVIKNEQRPAKRA